MSFCLLKSRNVMSWLEAKDNEWFEYFIYSGSVTLCLMFTYCSFLLNSVFIRHVYLGFLLSILGSDDGKQKHWCCSTRDSGGRDGQTKAGDPAVQRLYSNTAAAPAGTGELALRLCGFKSWNLHTQRESVFNIYRCWVKGKYIYQKQDQRCLLLLTLLWNEHLTYCCLCFGWNSFCFINNQ